MGEADFWRDKSSKWAEGDLGFKHGEVVKGRILSVELNEKYNSLTLKVDVDETEDIATVRVPSKPDFVMKQFCKEMWTPAELDSEDRKLSDLVGKKLSAKAEISEYEGKKYLNWRNFKKITATLEDV